MTKSVKVGIAGLIVYSLIATVLLLNNGKSEVDYSISEPNVEEIKQDSIFRDSINNNNDSIEIKIVYVEKEYEENVSTIMSNDDSLNLLFFSEYIECYNNQRAIKNSEFDIH